MTRTYCDRCKKEITNNMVIKHFSIYEGDSPKLIVADICEDCYKAFEAFMRMENSMYQTRDILHNPSGNHGIERMTFGSK